MAEALFIVLEGVDGAGTTTQARRLQHALAARGRPVHLTRQPSDGPIGVMIRQFLRGRIVVPGNEHGGAPSWATMALLFAADRLDHLDAEVVPQLRAGTTVITDRYDYSSVAYQSLTSSDPNAALPWVRSANAQARRPDLTLVLDLPAEVAAQRRRDRRELPDLYEVDALQRRLVEFYTEIDRHFPDDHIVHIDAQQDIDSVHDAVIAAVDAATGGRS